MIAKRDHWRDFWVSGDACISFHDGVHFEQFRSCFIHVDQGFFMKQGQTVLEAKRFGCHCCSPDTPLVEAVTQMVNHDISCLVVTGRDGYLAGIITRNDALRGYLASDDWQHLPVGDYMTRDVVTVTPQDLLATVANLLLDHHIHRVVVVREENGRHKPLAVVSDTDLIYHMMKEIG
jgi:CBS domain-containing protein